MKPPKHRCLLPAIPILVLSLLFIPGKLLSYAQSNLTDPTATPESEIISSQDLSHSLLTNAISTTYLLFPLIIAQPGSEPPPPPLPPETVLYCSDPDIAIPDSDPAGVTDIITIDDPRIIWDMDVYLDISHTFVGDIAATLVHSETNQAITIMNRPRNTETSKRCSFYDINSILDDETSLPVDLQCINNPPDIYNTRYLPAVSGIFTPTERLSRFDSEPVAGKWVLTVSDNDPSDTGRLNRWCLTVTMSNVPPPPPTSPPIPQLPNRASVAGVTGKNQALPLDCESRVAVDWAKFFGVSIGEIEFFNQLPVSDNPDVGFVGDVYGSWGQIPPHPYGVHAEPVATLLKKYGLSAYAHRLLSWDALRSEIAAGRPVYVWVIGSASSNEIPIYYFSHDGHLTIVAHYEHTVMVTGYTENSVSIRDGASTYTRSLDQFLSSWSALQNMAITTQP